MTERHTSILKTGLLWRTGSSKTKSFLHPRISEELPLTYGRGEFPAQCDSPWLCDWWRKRAAHGTTWWARTCPTIFGLCASPLMGQDHNMSSNLAGKGPKRTLCLLRTPKDVQDQRPTDMITCQSGRGEQYASRLVYVHDTVKQVKHCILLTFTYLCFTC